VRTLARELRVFAIGQCDAASDLLLIGAGLLWPPRAACSRRKPREKSRFSQPNEQPGKEKSTTKHITHNLDSRNNTHQESSEKDHPHDL
jgi:hypothetical protein